MKRTCACGCGQELEARDARHVYASKRCGHRVNNAKRYQAPGGRTYGPRSVRDQCIVTFRHESGEVFTCEGKATPSDKRTGRTNGGITAAKADALAQAERRRGGALGDPQRLNTRVDLPRPQAHGGLT